jgi:hypothetical protein
MGHSNKRRSKPGCSCVCKLFCCSRPRLNKKIPTSMFMGLFKLHALVCVCKCTLIRPYLNTSAQVPSPLPTLNTGTNLRSTPPNTQHKNKAKTHSLSPLPPHIDTHPQPHPPTRTHARTRTRTRTHTHTHTHTHRHRHRHTPTHHKNKAKTHSTPPTHTHKQHKKT